MATVTNFDLDTTSTGFNGTASYTEGAVAKLLAPNASVTATGNFSGQTLTISGLLAEDVIGFDNGVSVSGKNIKIGKTTIGTVGGTGGSDFVITFNTNATANEVQILQRMLTRKNLGRCKRQAVEAALLEIRLERPDLNQANSLAGGEA